MNTYILAIDQGTTSTRAIIFDHEMHIVGIAQRELMNYYPHPGWVEQNANDIWASCVGVIGEVMAKCNIADEQIAAIGITNQRETSLIWDKESGQPIHFAIVWQSRQSNTYIEDWKQKGKASWIQEKTGLILDPYFSASKIRYILDHVEGAQKRAEEGKLLFGTIDTWLVWKLTQGECHISDVSNASRTMLMNLKTLDYDEELLQFFHIPKCILPKIQDSSAYYAMATGIFKHPVPITSIIGDQQAALFGQTCFESGDVKNTYGTGCFLLMNTKDKIIQSSNGLLTSVGWRIQDEVNYVLEGSVFVAGAAIQWLRDGLKMIETSAETSSRAKETKSDGIYVVPAFTGLGTPYWCAEAKGAMFGLTRGTTQNQIIRATLESLAYQTNDVVMAMQKDSGISIHQLYVDRGASRNEFLMQFQADLLNVDVIRAMHSETTALGAALLAGLGIGYWKDKAEIKQLIAHEKNFHPSMDANKRSVAINGWKKAIHAVLAFHQDEV